MARNRSQDPLKPVSDTVPLSSYNALVKSFSLKLKALETKYQGFVINCTKIIKDAQTFLDVSINEHLSTSVNQSSKLLENLTKQKVKLKKDLKSIQKMSVDLQNTEETNKNPKFLGYFRGAKDKILEKLDDHKSKYFIQTVLMNLEDKVMKELEIFGNFGEYYSKLYEVEELLRVKTKEFEVLQESFNKVRGETEQMHLTERRVGSPSFRMMAGRTSPLNFMNSQNKDQEIVKLKMDIGFLQEKIVSLTGTAKKIVARKENALQKLMGEQSKIGNMQGELSSCFVYFDNFQDLIENKLRVLARSIMYLSDKLSKLKIWKKLAGFRADDQDAQNIKKGLESMVTQLNEDLRKKDEISAQQKEKFLKLNKLYSDLHEKSKIFNLKYDTLLSDYNEKSQKYNDLANKFSEIGAENEKLRNYKSDLDKEINGLKDYFQADIDSLSDKIEKLFGENLCLKQKNEEIRGKYERVMGEKEKLLVQVYENHVGDGTVKGESGKGNNNSLMALRQELKISGFKVESLVKENSILKSEQKQVVEYFFKQIMHLFSDFYSKFNAQFLSKVQKMFEKVLKVLNLRRVKFNLGSSPASNDILKNKIAELSKSGTKLSYDNEKLQKKCDYYENLISHLQQTCEKLTSQQDSLYKCSTCDSFSRIAREKDDRIKYLQSEIQTLNRENARLNKEIQEIEFTFQNHIQDSKAYEYEKPSKSKKLTFSSEFIKTEFKNTSQSFSDVDLTYTLEGTTIKSTHDVNTPISVSNDEIKDLEFIE